MSSAKHRQWRSSVIFITLQPSSRKQGHKRKQHHAVSVTTVWRLC